LITPRVVLTAAHCVDPVTLQLPSQEVVTASTSVLFDADVINEGFQGEGFFVAAAETIPNAGFSAIDLGDDDIGIIVLEEAVEDREPVKIELNPERNLIGENTVQVGFGIFDQFGNSGTEFIIEDQPVANCGLLFGGSNNLLVCFDQSNGQGKCNGDSGGPTFDQNGVQIGVTSFGDQGCVQFGADTRISAEAEFLAAVINPTEECGEDGTCNPNCGLATLPNDPDCEVDEGRCSVSPASDSSSVFASLVGVFVALFVARRRRN
jgi:MYXO-CTERM domain-containing protein